MSIENVIARLNDDETFENELGLLYDLLVERPQGLIDAIVGRILKPEGLADAHRFAGILEAMGREEFVGPLVSTLSTAGADSKWLYHYLYALGMILDERDKEIRVDEILADKLCKWLLNTGGGGISLHAASVLEHVENETCFDAMVAAARDKALFHLTRLCCLRWLVNMHGDRVGEVLEELTSDLEEEVSKAAISAKKWLERRKRRGSA